MDLGLSGKRALVLASSRGLGRAIAMRLAAEGARVMFTGRTEAALAGAVEEVTRVGSTADYRVVDLADPETPDRLVAAMAEAFEGCDILVNNTGGPPPGPLASFGPDVWRAQFDVMVVRVMSIAHAVLPGMLEAGWGRILTVTSSGVLQPIPNLGLSNALRSSLVGWNKTLSDEVAGRGITANILVPGRIATERLAQLNEANAKRAGVPVESVIAASLAQIPAGRFGTPEEFADVAVFLASTRASYVTGSVVRIDGGAVRHV